MAGFEDFARQVARDCGETITNTKRVLESAFAVIEAICDEGDKVMIRNFGTFSNRTTPAHAGRDPQTGKEIQIPAKTKLVFKRSKNA